MGEDIYRIDNNDIMFDAMDEEFSCLCTFPHNDKIYGELGIERIKALALFGAAVHLLMSSELDGPVYIPDNLPRWIVDAVRRIRFEED